VACYISMLSLSYMCISIFSCFLTETMHSFPAPFSLLVSLFLPFFF
jgi:hypothetical protein